MMYSCGEAAIRSTIASLAAFKSSADLIHRTSPFSSILKMSKGGSMAAGWGTLARRLRGRQVAESPGLGEAARPDSPWKSEAPKRPAPMRPAFSLRWVEFVRCDGVFGVQQLDADAVGHLRLGL